MPQLIPPLPAELWEMIALRLRSGTDYQTLLQALDASTSALLQSPGARKRWLMRRLRNDPNEVLLFAHRHRLMDVACAVIDAPPGDYYYNDYNDYNAYCMTAVGDYAIATASRRHAITLPRIVELSLAFTQIVMQAAPGDKDDDYCKLFIIKRLLDSYKSTIADTRSTIETTTTAVSAHELAVIALRWSAYYAEQSIVEYLLNDYGLRVNSFQCSSSWLIRMLNEERFSLLRLLLRHGVCVGNVFHHSPTTTNTTFGGEEDSAPASLALLPGQNEQGHGGDDRSSSTMIYALKAMAAAGNVKACRFLLHETPEFSLATDSGNNPDTHNHALYTVLVTASAYNKPQVIEMISEEYPEYPAAVQDPNRDCLISATYHNHLECVRLLRKHYLPRDQVRCEHVLFALRLSAGSNSSNSISRGGSCKEIMQILWEVYQFESDGERAEILKELLKTCCLRGRADAVEWLIEQSFPLSLLSSAEVFDCIRLAAKAGHLSTVDRAMQVLERRCAVSIPGGKIMSYNTRQLGKYRLRLLAVMSRYTDKTV